MATFAFWVAASVVAAAVGVGAFLLVSEPVAEATAAYLRWRETRREQRSVA